MLDVDDLYPEHPKLVRLGTWCEVAGWLNLAAMCWCKRYLTDGVLPRAVVWRLVSFRGMAIDGEPVTPEGVAAKLVEAELWKERGQAYLIHDFLEYQESKGAVLARRQMWRDRQRKHRDSQPNVPVTHDVTRDSRVTSASPSPSPSKEDPDARARARCNWKAARAQDRSPETPRPRHGIARAGPPRGGEPMRLGDLLAAAVERSSRGP